jgi:hypothetical protein
VEEDDMKVSRRRRGRAYCSVGIDRRFGAALAILVPALALSQPESKLTVRVYNYAQVSDARLANAEAEARRIFGAAGVDSVWLDCSEPRPNLQSGTHQDCAGPEAGATVTLRILPASSPANSAFRDTVFGFADGSVMASVFYGRIADLAHGLDWNNLAIPVILGDAITHELGHLLPGPSAHSPTGIMCANWDPSHLCSALRGHQFFTAQQSKHVRNEVWRRNGFDQTQLVKAQE